MAECNLCCEEKEIMTVGICEHPYVCLECTYKCRIKTKNLRCIYCNQDLPKVAAIENLNKKFSELELTSQDEFKTGIYFTSQKTKSRCFSLESTLCPIQKCGKLFAEIKSLKKHLLASHKRVFCEICLDKQALLLSEQKIYRLGEYDEHLEKGDFDDENNIIMFHPWCVFCEKRFFNEEEFMRHVRSEHIRCTYCDPNDTKCVYYSHQISLRAHQFKSHIVCNMSECVDKQGVVFRSKEEFEGHLNKIHYKNNQKPKVVIGGQSVKEDKFVFKDKEGVDLSGQVD